MSQKYGGVGVPLVHDDSQGLIGRDVGRTQPGSIDFWRRERHIRIRAWAYADGFTWRQQLNVLRFHHLAVDLLLVVEPDGSAMLAGVLDGDGGVQAVVAVHDVRREVLARGT